MLRVRTSHLTVVLLLAALRPALAEDQMIDVAPCNFFCSLARNVTGKAPGTTLAPTNEAAAPVSLPAATEGAEHPDPSSIVSQRGVVMVQTPAEKAGIARQRRILERATTKVISDGQASLRRLSAGEKATAPH